MPKSLQTPNPMLSARASLLSVELEWFDRQFPRRGFATMAIEASNVAALLRAPSPSPVGVDAPASAGEGA